MNGRKKMTKRIDDSVIDAEDIIGLRLLKNHTHFLMGEIDDENVEKAIRWLIYENMDTVNVDKTLTLYINSMGGSLTDAFALIDIMRNSPFVVRTIGIGNIMSSAFLIFAAGDKGERYISKNASIMSHQFTDSAEAKYHDMKAALKETEYCNKRMVDILTEATGLAPSRVKSKLLPPSDVYLTAEELISFGVADHILGG
jgi:ATP-dependent Clp protease, protease subunit